MRPRDLHKDAPLFTGQHTSEDKKQWEKDVEFVRPLKHSHGEFQGGRDIIYQPHDRKFCWSWRLCSHLFSLWGTRAPRRDRAYQGHITN